MSMDAIFHFDEQEFVSKPVVLREFFEEAIRKRDFLEMFFGAKMGEKDAWQNKFIPWLQRMNLVDGAALPDIRRLVNDVAAACSNPTKQYCFEKDGGLSNIQLNKRSRLRSVNILQELNAKRKNPHYKSISLRSMLYDKYDPYVFVRRAHHSDLDVREEDMPAGLENDEKMTAEMTTQPLEDEKMFVDTPIEPSDDGMFEEGYTYCQSPSTGSSFPSSTSSSATSMVPVVFEEQFQPDWNYHQECNDLIYMPCSPTPIPIAAAGIECQDNVAFCPPLAQTALLLENEIDWMAADNHMEDASRNQYNAMICPPLAQTAPLLPKSEIPWEGITANDYGYAQTCNEPLKSEPWIDASMTNAAAVPQQSTDPVSVNSVVLVKQEEPDTYNLDMEPSAPTDAYSCSDSAEESNSGLPLDDIVVEIAIFLGYPRPLEKHEIRLGRLMKVLDRFLMLGSNTLKDLKNAIDCTSDYQVLEDVVDRSITKEDLCKSRYPSSYFFFHDTFYIDLEPKGSKDITLLIIQPPGIHLHKIPKHKKMLRLNPICNSIFLPVSSFREIREWANERNIADMKVADMNTTRIVDLTCRFGAPYLYNHVGACEHLVVMTRAVLRDTSHSDGPYPLPIYERNFRRIACAGCKEETAEWVMWEHECMPCYAQFLCDACYKEFNYDMSGKRIFKYKAAPWYDRRSRKTGPLDLQKMKIFKAELADDTD